jgi:hypothetical protein
VREEMSKGIRNLRFRFFVAQTLYNLVKDKRVGIEVLIVW